MCSSRIRNCYRYLDNRFTDFSLYVDEKVHERSLLDIPLLFWKWFKYIVYIHFFLAILLFVYGVLCFCLGVQYSFYYTEVNCGDGMNVWPPAVNLIASVCGMVTLRTLHIHWSPFIHLTLLVTSIPFVLATVIDLAFAVERWERQPTITAPPGLRPSSNSPLLSRISSSEAQEIIDDGTYYVRIPQWKYAFVGMDSGLAALAFINLVTISVIIFFYLRWWCRKPRLPSP